jgi:sugar/nucleoside kinase (ribokinase family)
MKKMKVSCVGCSLADFVYANVNFSSDAFKKYLSRTDGDGGLNPGHLVFAEDLEKFAGKPFAQVRDEITGGAQPHAFNIGGPAIVALINAAQLLYDQNIEFDFYGALGQDDTAEKILSILKQTPVNIDNYIHKPGFSPFTDVFSDPNYHDGKGERSFVNNIGSAWEYTPAMLDKRFFDADIVFFGATALVPLIHDHLTTLLKKGREEGCVNIVTTVFDFRNEKKNAGGKWPLGESDESYRLIDLLIVDWEEAMKLSGKKNIDDAVEFFIANGLRSFIITHGAENFYAWSDGSFFKKQELIALPVCSLVGERIKKNPELRGDTTGCGDNFAGGVLASVARQFYDGKKGSMDIIEACSWGCGSGGFACFYIGGTYLEKAPGEKKAKVSEFQQTFKNQLEK